MCTMEHVSEMVVVDTKYRHPPTYLQVTCTLTRYCKNVGAWCYILCQQLPFQRHAPWCTCTSLCMYMQAEVCAITDFFHLPTEIIPWGGGGGGGGGLLLADGVLEDPWELLGHSACIAKTRRCAQTT